MTTPFNPKWTEDVQKRFDKREGTSDSAVGAADDRLQRRVVRDRSRSHQKIVAVTSGVVRAGAVGRKTRRVLRTMTYQIALAAGFDEGNRHAKKHGRKIWTVDDFNAAARKVDELLEEDPNKYTMSFTTDAGPAVGQQAKSERRRQTPKRAGADNDES
jgi:hypothetical protein